MKATSDLRDRRILVITDRYPHAGDRISSSFVKNQIEYLRDHVKHVSVIALLPFVPKLLSHFDFMNGKGRYDGYAEDYSYDNVDVYFAKPWSLPLEFSRRRRGDDGLLSAKRVIRKNKIEFDLIHAHFTYPAGYVGAKLKEFYGKRLILTVHEDRNWLLQEISSHDRRFMYAWQSADRIIRVNRADLKEFEKIGIGRSKLACIPNGFSPRKFYPVDQVEARRSLGLPQDARILLNLASLEIYKGQEYLIHAMKDVAAARSDVVLYIVGKGSLRGKLQSLIDDLGLTDRAVLAGGNKTEEELLLWMNSCDLFVLPSLSESFGIVQIEAMACGKPVVATRNGGSEEIIVDDRLGILVRSKNVGGLAKAILEALERGWNAEYILNFSDQFKWHRIAEQTANLYQDLILEIG